MKNEGIDYSTTKSGSDMTEKLHYEAPVLRIYGRAEAITQSNGNGRNTDSAQYACGEGGHSEVCSS